ncbi:MAG: class I SAM-dependent methyltransferase [Ardenticatenales bacterium]|nr:class I SAM-dependent methyltransferase [Ardenticatenales bacterium]
MSVFGAYASFYDSLYQEKDYEGECDFVEQVFAQYATSPVRRILDLGCGTGGHLLPLAQRGYEVAGVDRSPEMLEGARRKLGGAGFSARLEVGDVREVDVAEHFDAVISMFAVMSYQIEQEDLLRAFSTAERHLEPGGLFLFDVWYGPGVLGDPPAERCKMVEGEGERILRLAHPEMDILRQTVTVHYRVLRLCGEQLLSEVEESHTMRFLFPQEIIHLLRDAGFEFLELCPFMRLGEQPGLREWSVSVVARKPLTAPSENR